MKYPYSHSVYPPAPTAEVTFITAAENLRAGPLVALLDTGADGTLVPIQYLDEIHAPATTEMFIRSQWGERRRVLMYLVDVQVGGLMVSEIEVVGDELSGEIVIGRDVLNRLRVFLDGPSETTEVLE